MREMFPKPILIAVAYKLTADSMLRHGAVLWHDLTNN
jgi:hypothetical protein